MSTDSMIVTTVGICFLAYGIVKLVLFFLIMFLPHETQSRLSKLPGMKWFFTNDDTLACKWTEYLLATFAVFSIVHGLAMLDAFPDYVCNLIESRPFQYTYYLVSGMSTVIFYALVLHTDVRISKNPDNKSIYEMYSLVGWSFLLVPLVWEIVLLCVPYFHKMTYHESLMFLTVLIMASAMIVMTAVVAK